MAKRSNNILTLEPGNIHIYRHISIRRYHICYLVDQYMKGSDIFFDYIVVSMYRPFQENLVTTSCFIGNKEVKEIIGTSPCCWDLRMLIKYGSLRRFLLSRIKEKLEKLTGWKGARKEMDLLRKAKKLLEKDNS